MLSFVWKEGGGDYFFFRHEKRNGVTKFRSMEDRSGSTKSYFIVPQVWRLLLLFQCGWA